MLISSDPVSPPVWQRGPSGAPSRGRRVLDSLFYTRAAEESECMGFEVLGALATCIEGLAEAPAFQNAPADVDDLDPSNVEHRKLLCW